MPGEVIGVTAPSKNTGEDLLSGRQLDLSLKTVQRYLGFSEVLSPQQPKALLHGILYSTLLRPVIIVWNDEVFLREHNICRYSRSGFGIGHTV